MLERQCARRRTFAIISHPDAGKTTLTEKLLLFGGAIEQAGAVRAKGEARRATSDWMKVEQERGISVSSSVMTFEYQDHVFNLLDTPGHQDFSEDTYRTLTAVDSAVMVIDVAKGIESQTRKLFEVCRLRDMPIVTFVNKMDREGRDPFHILDEVEQSLAIDVVPASWPIGMGRDFKGVYDLFNDRLILLENNIQPKSTGNKTSRGKIPLEGQSCSGLEDPLLDQMLGVDAAEKLREDVEMVRGLCPAFDRKAYLEGSMTAVYFGSAINNFGVRELLQGLCVHAPAPQSAQCKERSIEPGEEAVSGFVFKVQANMDPKHRDRIAFVRLCSGHFKKGLKLYHVRSGKNMAVHTPTLFMAQERGLAEEAWPGDIIGIPNHGTLRIADTLTQGEVLHITGIPSFAPELLQSVRALDPLKVKHLGKALQQIAEEGAARVLKRLIGGEYYVGVIGALQFEVLADRIRNEFNIEARFEQTPLYTARWIEGAASDLKAFGDKNRVDMGEDHTNAPVFLVRNAWHLGKAQEDWGDRIAFLSVKEQDN